VLTQGQSESVHAAVESAGLVGQHAKTVLAVGGIRAALGIRTRREGRKQQQSQKISFHKMHCVSKEKPSVPRSGSLISVQNY